MGTLIDTVIIGRREAHVPEFKGEQTIDDRRESGPERPAKPDFLRNRVGCAFFDTAEAGIAYVLHHHGELTPQCRERFKAPEESQIVGGRLSFADVQFLRNVQGFTGIGDFDQFGCGDRAGTGFTLDRASPYSGEKRTFPQGKGDCVSLSLIEPVVGFGFREGHVANFQIDLNLEKRTAAEGEAIRDIDDGRRVIHGPQMEIPACQVFDQSGYVIQASVATGNVLAELDGIRRCLDHDGQQLDPPVIDGSQPRRIVIKPHLIVGVGHAGAPQCQTARILGQAADGVGLGGTHGGKPYDQRQQSRRPKSRAAREQGRCAIK